MNLDFDLSPTKEEVYQPVLPPRFQEFNKTAEEIGGNAFPQSIGVLNTISDAHADGYHPRKRIRLVLSGQGSPEESALLISVGSAAGIIETSTSTNFSVKGIEPLNGPSNDALCYAAKATGMGSPKLIDSCIEEQDYIGSINLVQDYLDKIRNIVMSGGSQDLLEAAVSAMEHATDMLTSMSSSSTLSHSRL